MTEPGFPSSAVRGKRPCVDTLERVARGDI